MQKGREMWLRAPDKECWWIAVSPTSEELLLYVETVDDGVLASWMPMNAVIEDGDRNTYLIVYFEDGRASDIIRDWRWKEIEIPSHCPEFDAKED